eukprot:superscaffoldBa00003247_g16469
MCMSPVSQVLASTEMVAWPLVTPREPSWGERQARATGALEAPPTPGPTVAFGRCGSAILLLSRTRCQVLQGASKMSR